MTVIRVLALLAAAAVPVLPGTAGAQSKNPATRSTLTGVYSEKQAERGRITYAGMCRSCHAEVTHTGPTFAKWTGRTVADLFTYTSTEMPKSDPGGLSPEEYADVIAYILKVNAIPAGRTDLPADSASLAAFIIETPARGARPAMAIPKHKERSTSPPRT